MKRTISIALPLVLLFVFVFSVVVTIHSTASAQADYTCCKVETCGEWTPPIWAYGVWYNGVCTLHPPANPNNCRVYQPGCP